MSPDASSRAVAACGHALPRRPDGPLLARRHRPLDAAPRARDPPRLRRRATGRPVEPSRPRAPAGSRTPTGSTPTGGHRRARPTRRTSGPCAGSTPSAEAGRRCSPWATSRSRTTAATSRRQPPGPSSTGSPRSPSSSTASRRSRFDIETAPRPARPHCSRCGWRSSTVVTRCRRPRRGPLQRSRWAVAKANGLLHAARRRCACATCRTVWRCAASPSAYGRVVERALVGFRDLDVPFAWRAAGLPELLPLGRPELLLGRVRERLGAGAGPGAGGPAVERGVSSTVDGRIRGCPR